MASTTPTPSSSLLQCEALGFSPQLLLDDIINVANNAVQDGVNGMEEFLEKWADERIARFASSSAHPSSGKPSSKTNAAAMTAEATTHEVEQGLVAFQTLLEYHTDIAFDFFEAWCLRNIFMIPPGLPVVLPHQEGLDLVGSTEEREVEAMEEVDALRRRLDAQRKLNRTLQRALRTATRQHKTATQRLGYLHFLDSSGTPPTPLSTLHTIPPKLLKLYETLSALPPLDDALVNPSNPTQGTDGKRQWETSKTGYVNWALGRLLVKGHPTPPRPHSSSQPSSQHPSSQQNSNPSQEDPQSSQDSAPDTQLTINSRQVDRLARVAHEVGGAGAMRGVLEALDRSELEVGDTSASASKERGEGEGEESMDVEDVRMGRG